MSKKPTKTKTGKPQPEAARLKAIERLIEGRDYARAVERIRPLIQRFPEHGGLRRLLIEALRHSEGARAAGLAAFEWAESRPMSVQAQETLLFHAMRLGHLLLAERAARQLRALGIDTPGFPLAPEQLAPILAIPDGTTATPEQIEQFDIAKLYLDAQDFAGAIQRTAGQTLLSSRNNHAMALFHLERIDEALTSFMAGWEADGDNLFALGWAARLRLYQGDETGARGLSTPLAAATARRVDDALLQLDALLLLREDSAAWEAFERFRRTEAFELGDALPRGVLLHFGACVACRLGRTAEARELLDETLRLTPDYQLAVDNRAYLDREGRAPAHPEVFDLSRAFPLTWLNRMRAAGGALIGEIAQLTASNDFLEATYVGADETLRRLIVIILINRAGRGDGRASSLLKDFLRRPIGGKSERFDLLRMVRERNLIGAEEAVDYWDGKGVTQIKLLNTEIHRERQDSGLPPALDALLSESIELGREGDYEGAETRLMRILERIPNHPVATGNLAAIRSLRGRPEETEQLLRQVVANHPEYPRARCNLANLLIRDGKLDEAGPLLEGLVTRERIHIQDFFAIYGSMSLLNRARGDDEAADALIATLEGMVEDEDDERQLRFVKNLQNSLNPKAGLLKTLASLVRSPPKPNRRPGA